VACNLLLVGDCDLYRQKYPEENAYIYVIVPRIFLWYLFILSPHLFFFKKEGFILKKERCIFKNGLPFFTSEASVLKMERYIF
jgi:hypothetical protein